MGYFPFFMDLEGQAGLIVGGGSVALRKVEKLLPYGPNLTVVAPEIHPDLAAIPDLKLLRREVRPGDVSDMRFVVAATDDRTVNHGISDRCRELNIPVNVVDDKEACTFLFPALVTRGSLSVGISTGGSSPTAAIWLKEQISRLLPRDLEDILSWLEKQRPVLKDCFPDEKQRTAVFSRLFSACLDKGVPLGEDPLAFVLAAPSDTTPGSVSLVGAGCGQADLLTLRALDRLRACTALVYDDLIDTSILDFAPSSALRFYMGKRSGRHAASQEAINDKLVELARAGHRVVRLKGGDPFVFGRGGEEALALQAAGIPFEVVPGISSAIAIPSAAGIPVTHRGMSRGFHVVTGHTTGSPDGLPLHLDELARSSDTLVFLMGLKNLPAIAQRLMDGGKPGRTPAAVVSGGNSPNPTTVRGTLADIAEKAASVRPPAVIVVGEVAGLDLSSSSPHPLEGISVGVTGTPAVTDNLSAQLGELGARVVFPLSSTPVLRNDLPTPDELLRPSPHWIVFTSANGVDLFFRYLTEHNTDLRTLGVCKFAVIGPATGAALARHGIYADLCPTEHTSAGLSQALSATVKEGETVLLFRSSDGAPILPQVLDTCGVSVRDLAAYDLCWEEPVNPPLSPDYLAFASAGAVKEFFRRYGAPGSKTVCVCIGPVTAQALRERFDRPFLEAEEISVHGMVQAILRHRER